MFSSIRSFVQDSANSLFTHPMSRKGACTLREQIKQLSGDAARVFDAAGLDESGILTLTRQDLNELLPGPQNFQIRRNIAELINSATQESPVSSSSLIERLKDVISREDVKHLLVSGGLLEDYLHVLHDAETRLACSLDCLRQHVKLLESLRTLPLEEPSSDVLAAKCPPQSHSKDQAQPRLNNSTTPVKIHSLMCGKTLGFHKDMLQRLGVPTLEVSLEECQVVLVFCPVSSRAGTNIAAAMKAVPGNKDAVLLVMHYTSSPKQSVTGIRPSLPENVREVVDIFFHDSMGGILNCEPNKHAVAVIESALKHYTNTN
ncbi:uncharacterized protein si:ch211-245h14.1 isoform X1 [Alosa sapidissima]|uniref:uncharacterized protein si:ch211-245h14.1 isoform X1 n=1 Tax=Alosa sapidissima TaxID=34773 RepID=UPI001C09D11B|nr:uncharacterized protein si:ch211-245h14.1 isoform X1 [Alosa sapidissima]